jgi:hypothetical protein
MKMKVALVLISTLLCVGCSEKQLCHDCFGSFIAYDWQATQGPEGDMEHYLSIIDSDNRLQFHTTDNNGKAIWLPPGDYRVVVGQQADNITYDLNVVELARLPDGSVAQPPVFDAGEGNYRVAAGEDNHIYVPMIRQTRDLLVRVVILWGHEYLADMSDMAGILSGATASRDILGGFGPRPASFDRPLAPSVYGDLHLNFAQQLASRVEQLPVYESANRLLGLSDRELIVTVKGSPTSQEELYRFDATEALSGFVPALRGCALLHRLPFALPLMRERHMGWCSGVVLGQRGYRRSRSVHRRNGERREDRLWRRAKFVRHGSRPEQWELSAQ